MFSGYNSSRCSSLFNETLLYFSLTVEPPRQGVTVHHIHILLTTGFFQRTAASEQRSCLLEGQNLAFSQVQYSFVRNKVPLKKTVLREFCAARNGFHVIRVIVVWTVS